MHHGKEEEDKNTSRHPKGKNGVKVSKKKKEI